MTIFIGADHRGFELKNKLVEYLQNTHGTQVEVVSFGKSSSAKLMDAADDFFDLDLNPRKYLIMGDNGRVTRRKIGA